MMFLPTMRGTTNKTEFGFVEIDDTYLVHILVGVF